MGKGRKEKEGKERKEMEPIGKEREDRKKVIEREG